MPVTLSAVGNPRQGRRRGGEGVAETLTRVFGESSSETVTFALKTHTRRGSGHGERVLALGPAVVSQGAGLGCIREARGCWTTQALRPLDDIMFYSGWGESP